MRLEGSNRREADEERRRAAYLASLNAAVEFRPDAR
jgi:hypothetical protein|tara:strand:+ start:283 stop:390 length:108 start_codon:yes stop_codon:yes gene_type:complete